MIISMGVWDHGEALWHWAQDLNHAEAIRNHYKLHGARKVASARVEDAEHAEEVLNNWNN
jgi:hypothetical protein